MRSREIVCSFLGIAIYLFGVSNVHAATVLLEDFQVVTEKTVSTTWFDVEQAGIYEVELIDFEFPSPFDILALGIVQGVEPLGIGFGTGSFTFNVSTPGMLKAHLAAVPGVGGMGTCAFQIKAIPLPPAAMLLLSGLIGLVLVARRPGRLTTA
ncbi:MAG: VPLPA-CTERM sorting domain-containing protein [Thiohalobacterales bacterium]|nr:VPLPA-CTERM sorting domain-containing protein [Thiohalobacterales bacterium]